MENQKLCGRLFVGFLFPCFTVMSVMLPSFAQAEDVWESRQVVVERVVTEATVTSEIVRATGCGGTYEVGESPCDHLRSRRNPGSDLYYFSLCFDLQNCEPIGNENGYTADAFDGLSGGLQQWVGAPVVFVLDVVVAAATPAFLLLSTYGWAAFGTALIFGGTGGATLPFVVPQDMMVLKQMNPRYHWTNGKVKRLIRETVNALEDEGGARIQKVALFISESPQEDKRLDKNLSFVWNILDSLEP